MTKHRPSFLTTEECMWKSGETPPGGLVATEALMKWKLTSHPKSKYLSTSRKHTSLPNLRKSNAWDKGLCVNELRFSKTVILLWLVTASNLIERYERFKEIYCDDFYSGRGREPRMLPLFLRGMAMWSSQIGSIGHNLVFRDLPSVVLDMKCSPPISTVPNVKPAPRLPATSFTDGPTSASTTHSCNNAARASNIITVQVHLNVLRSLFLSRSELAINKPDKL